MQEDDAGKPNAPGKQNKNATKKFKSMIFALKTKQNEVIAAMNDVHNKLKYLKCWGSSEEQNFDLAKLIFIRVWYVHADQINFIS